MKDFDKDDQNQTKDKTITIPSIEKTSCLCCACLLRRWTSTAPRIHNGAKGNCRAPTAL